MARFLVVDLGSMGEHHSQIVKAPDEDTALRAYIGSLGVTRPIEEQDARNLIETGELTAIEIKPTSKLIANKDVNYYTGPISWDDEDDRDVPPTS